MMFARLFLLLLTILQIVHFVQASPDPKTSIRLSEVHVESQGKLSSYTTFAFVEVSTNFQNVDASNMTVVIYGASSMSVIHSCSCDKVVFNEQGLGLCDCGNYGFQTLEFVGAIALHNAGQSNFPVGANAKDASQMNVLDAILWQSYGELLPNPLYSLFALGQTYQYQPPLAIGTVYSINRCFGNPLTTGSLQASYALSPTATQDGPNMCMAPSVTINEIHLSANFIELSSVADFPLDNVSLALVSDTMTVTWAYDLASLFVQGSGLFTIGPFGADYMDKNLNLPSTGPVALVVYYKTTITVGSTAPNYGFLSSVVYSNVMGPTAGGLSVFGLTTYAIDSSGTCSLSNCTVDGASSMIFTFPSMGSPNDCSKVCEPKVQPMSRKLFRKH